MFPVEESVADQEMLTSGVILDLLLQKQRASHKAVGVLDSHPGDADLWSTSRGWTAADEGPARLEWVAMAVSLLRGVSLAQSLIIIQISRRRPYQHSYRGAKLLDDACQCH